jgi:hypothetical protein
VIARVLAGATLILTTVRGGQALAQGTAAETGTSAAPGTSEGPGAAPGENRGVAPAAGDGANGRPERVELTVVGAQTPYQSLRDRIGAVTPSGVPLSWSRIDRFNPLAELLQSDPRAHLRSLRCWVDLSDLSRATLYFAAPGGERFLVREVGLSGRLDEVDQQSLTQVLELSIAALIENQETGFSRSEARAMLSRPATTPPTLTVPARPQRRPGRASLAIGVFYAVEDVAATLPAAHGPGLDLALRLDSYLSATGPEGSTAAPAHDHRAHPGLWLGGQYRLPISARLPDVGVRLRTIAARAGVQAEWWRLCARLGAGADWVEVTPLAGTADPSAILSATHWSANLALSGSLAARIPLAHVRGHEIELGLTAFADVVPTSVRYEVQDGAGVHAAFSPRRVRPGFALGLSF